MLDTCFLSFRGFGFGVWGLVKSLCGVGRFRLLVRAADSICVLNYLEKVARAFNSYIRAPSGYLGLVSALPSKVLPTPRHCWDSDASQSINPKPPYLTGAIALRVESRVVARLHKIRRHNGDVAISVLFAVHGAPLAVNYS